MHPKICLYFQVHQPYRLRDIRITEIGRGNIDYFDGHKNEQIFRKVAEKCYLPANALMLELLEQYPDFHVSYSLSGVFLDQCREYGQDVLQSFQALARTGKVEFLAETYYHSLASVISLEEYCLEVKKHAETIRELFGEVPRVFRNTELIYNNELAHIARLMGFRGILAEGADAYLQGRNPNDPFRPPDCRLSSAQEKIVREHRPLPMRSRDIAVLLKNYRLSDDVAFRFSDTSWIGYPLHADTFTDWLMQSGGQSVNLFMDYETFGEHQWEDTGIFEFLRSLPALWQERGVEAVTPSQVISAWKKKSAQEYDVHNAISWADMERDLSAWMGNPIQNAALQGIFALEQQVKATENPVLLENWRRLLTSDHFYHMCTKYWSDGDVHRYFSPYESPYEAYRRFSHAIHDLRSRLAS
ncbi:alpha-amylase [Candidatus Peregrinibacteria bacterium CG10_big_fil_rev_8_21_14_0_10_49_10]|nr:MAG: alpha-amylase [Candidatus Peregrinibacteria bacterium CG10_big_fil_rev_8_21_14_0_10_49_10]